jgi:Uncharacterized protein conserved in bacteria
MKRNYGIVMVALLLTACSQEQSTSSSTEQKNVVQKVTAKVRDTFDVSTPMGKPDDPATLAAAQQQREKERFDQQWRQLQSFKAQEAAKAQAAQAATASQAAPSAAPLAPSPFKFVSGVKQKFSGLDAKGINDSPVSLPISGDVRGPSVLRTQVYLDRNHYSVGALDGRWGRNSAITVWWWQHTHGIEPTGDVDEMTFRSIAQAAGNAPVVVSHVLTADDVKGPFVSIPSSPYDKAKLDCLCYETLREKLAERFHCTEDFLELINPDVKIADLQAGASINVPNVRDALTTDQHDIAKVIISIAGNSYNAFDAAGNLIFHAPTTLGSGYDPSPNETVKVTRVVPMPHFHYDPTLYHEVPDTDPDAQLNPGPNSPVGVVWMALSKPHYGMHGTPDPDSIGYASSHGCVRLTNWDAAEVSHRISVGVEVSFVDISHQGMPEVAKK